MKEDGVSSMLDKLSRERLAQSYDLPAKHASGKAGVAPSPCFYCQIYRTFASLLLDLAALGVDYSCRQETF
jgi:hypothetical protein